MPDKRRCEEDTLTKSLAAALQHEEARSVFWRRVAPRRLAANVPGVPVLFQYFRGTRPDLLFLRHGEPIFYIEAKLDSGTEPIQLARARSMMRLAGAEDDQVLLLSRTVDHVPPGVGWDGPTLPCDSMTWVDVLKAFDRAKAAWQPETLTALERFRATWLELAKNKTEHDKHKDLTLKSGHPCGAVIQVVANQWSGIRAEFSYGGNIAPRIHIGLTNWQEALGTRDVERLSVECRLRDDGREYYGASFVLWHALDLKGSRDGIRHHWKHWREAITADPVFKLHLGGREENRKIHHLPPEAIPRVNVGLLRRPNSGLPVAEVQRLPVRDMVRRVKAFLLPYMQLAERVRDHAG